MLSTNVKYFKDEYVIVKYLGFRIFQNIFTLTANMMHKKMTKQQLYHTRHFTLCSSEAQVDANLYKS